jgi:hypothetical protein
MSIFYQCRMECGEDKTVGWIEARGAVVGYEVELKEDGRFWKVVEVYPTGINEEVLRTKQKLDRESLSSISMLRGKIKNG